MRKLASSEDESLERCCDVLARILAAPHLLKVVHSCDYAALQILERAVFPVPVDDDAYTEDFEPPPQLVLAPVVDIALCGAYVQRQMPYADSLKINNLTFDFLRIELDMSEVMSNFERRPLRQSQVHYALTLAWCPLMILRALSAYGVLDEEQVQVLVCAFGSPGHEGSKPTALDDLRAVQLVSAAGLDEASGQIGGSYGQNLWTEAEWREQLPTPDPGFDLRACILGKLGELPAEYQSAQTTDAVRSLFDEASVHADLEALYSEYRRKAAERSDEVERRNSPPSAQEGGRLEERSAHSVTEAAAAA